jgi:GNAT superfamily N-acetyltransferase
LVHAVSFAVTSVPASATLALRQRVLRPHQRVEDVAFEGDGDPRAAHFAAVDDGAVVGVVSVLPQPPQWAASGPGWRLRGMAAVPERRREGIGRALAAAVVAHVEHQGGGLLWCNARLTAVPFYVSVGFEARGEPWEEPGIGPHVAMVYAA